MNTTFKGTPGPWCIETPDPSDTCPHESVLYHICTPGIIICGVYSDQDLIDSSEHDAALIAAAPEMLQALITCMDKMNEQDMPTEFIEAIITKALTP